jgi:hypothetical protein
VSHSAEADHYARRGLFLLQAGVERGCVSPHLQ